jgi:hypothetical protein
MRAAGRAEFDIALQQFLRIINSSRFCVSNEARVERYCDAMVNAAQILERVQRRPEAVLCYQRLLSESRCPALDQQRATERLLGLSP